MADTKKQIHKALATHADEYRIKRELPSRAPNAVYEVTLDGRRAVCKVVSGDDAQIRKDALATRYVYEQTPIPISRVLAIEDDCAIFEWAEGITYDADTNRALREHRLRNAGATLATLHESTSFVACGYLNCRDGELTLDARETWAALLATILDGWCDDLVGTRFEEAGESVQSFVREHGDGFTAVSGPEFVHGDYQPANLLFEDESVAAVLDWEFCFAGAGEFDLCRAEREFFDWHTAPEDDDLRGSIREGYESVRTLPPGFEWRRHVYRAVLKLDPMRFFEAWNGQVENADEMAESMCSFVHDELELARKKL
ncbi:phosphotransferase family protein [Haladaptatus sp. NG-SE-30]